jgi:CheY-like chemotaxis protein
MSDPLPAHVSTVLLVEDDFLVRQTAAEVLANSGYQVVEAEDGDKALEILDAGATIDLVFSDIKMPGQTDGCALARWIRQHRPRLPVMLTSGYTETKQRAVALCDSFLDKPYGPQEVLEEVARLVEGAR